MMAPILVQDRMSGQRHAVMDIVGHKDMFSHDARTTSPLSSDDVVPFTIKKSCAAVVANSGSDSETIQRQIYLN